LEPQLRQAGELVDLARLANGEHDGDPLGQHAAPDERERLGRGAIQPLRVLDQAHQRARLRDFGEQAQGRQRDEKAVRRGPFL
jgi:hypothetical protein